MPRKPIPAHYLHEIAHVMLNRGMANAPRLIFKHFRELEKSDDPLIAEQFAEPITIRTIEKYMEKARKGELSLLKQRGEFSYPVHMGAGEDQVPWELAQYALDCVYYYIKNYRMRPSIGLTRRYAQLANVTQEPTPMEIQPRAVYAEKFWYADLVGATPKRERPSTEFDELYIASKAWASTEHDKDFADLAISLKVKEMTVWNRFGFVRHMPEFNKVLQKWYREQEKMRAQENEEDMTQYKEDFDE